MNISTNKYNSNNIINSYRYPIKIISILFLFCAIVSMGTANNSKVNNETNELIGNKYSVLIPRDWATTTHPDDKDCAYLKSINSRPNLEFSLLVCINTGTAIEIANKKGFYKDEEEWFRGGSMDSQSATLTTISGHPTITGNATCGITTESGFHAALGDCHTWIIFGSGYGVSFETDGLGYDGVTIDEILKSIKLSNPESRSISTLLDSYPKKSMNEQ